MTHKFRVAGMTCGHCRSHVSQAVTSLPGVTDVDIDMANGIVSVTGDVDDTAVVKAITNAGYDARPVE